MNIPRRRRYRMTTRAAGQALTRERIQQAAIQLFLSRPYDAVSMKDIAAAADVSVPTLVLHFGTKDNLINELVKVAGPREDALRKTPGGDVMSAARVLVQRYEETGDGVLRLLAIEDRFPAIRRV